MSDPSSISGLQYWVKSDTGVYKDAAKTQACADGDSVYTWADQSGNGRDFVQATSANRPVFHTNRVNGLAAVTFGGAAATNMANTHPSVSQPYTICTVFKPVSLSNTYNCMCDTAAGGPQISYEKVGGTTPTYYMYWGTQVYGGTSKFGIFADYIASFNTTASYTMSQGVIITAAGNPGAGAIQNTILGNSPALVNNIVGDMAEFFLYNKALSVADLELLTTYASSRYGWTLPGMGRNRVATEAVIGYLQGICLGCPSSIHGDDSFGRHLQVGVVKNTTDGSPAQPSLQLSIPGFWRFKWVVKAGARTITINTKQAANLTPYPSMIVRASPGVLATDQTASSAGGTGWTTIGPISFTALADGVVWVELWNNCVQKYDTPALFDHVVVT